MFIKSFKSLLVAAFGLFFMTLATTSFADGHAPDATHEKPQGENEKLNPGKILLSHVLDAHEFHFFDYDGHAVTLPLPVILYSPERGFTSFMSSNFDHGHADYNGYRMTKDPDNDFGRIVPVNEQGQIDETVSVYDFSITRNVAMMLLASVVLIIILINIGKKYTRQGSKKAPSGFQNAVEPVITFVRDEVAKPNLGKKYEKFLPYLLSLFFFILILNLFGLIPGAANVTGNIGFTIVLAICSLVVILFATNKHFWAHIFNPPVPGPVKPVLALVEFLGIFIKPAALAIRLFANLVAGHMIITCLILMIFIFAEIAPIAGASFSPVSLAFTMFIYTIEILVAFIQAFIFTNLTAVFVGMSMEGEHDHHEEGAHH